MWFLRGTRKDARMDDKEAKNGERERRKEAWLKKEEKMENYFDILKLIL